MSHDDWKEMRKEFGKLHGRINQISTRVTRNTTNIEWLKWGLMTTVGFIIVGALAIWGWG